MSGVPVTIIGKVMDSDGTTKMVQIDGIMAHAGLDVGHPLPTPPVFPAHPIVLPPVGVWPPGGVVSPPIYYPPYPSHPIVLPEPPEIPDIPERPPIDPPGGGLSEGWQWYYTDRWGFVLVFVPPGGGGKPQPPTPPGGPSVTPHK
jgi:hypothetical protein